MLLPNPQSDLKCRWEKVRTQLESVAHLLETQGVLERKSRHTKSGWRVRFVERVEGRQTRRTIHVGKDPELLRRVEQYLAQCRDNGLWVKQSHALAKLILRGGFQDCIEPVTLKKRD
ncbi:MAG TPA: hypothetical protein VE988_17975 [Gemmataceae bacterium]|nr:hypothetical protein [Gemmataceae bacterium]